MRKPHYLRHNVRAESPSQCIFFDTETTEKPLSDGSKLLELKFGMACYTRRIRDRKWSQGDWLTFTTPEQLWKWVASKARPKVKTYMFAHNLVFDLTVTKGFSILPKMGWKLEKAIIDDPPSILQYRWNRSGLCLLDTFNWFHSALADIGQSIGLEKLSMPVDLDYSASWEVYTRRDVEIIKAAMLSYMDFVADNDLGNFQMTLASQSFSAYRHRFMTDRILIDSNEKSLNLAREGYHGGRTEAFYIGEKTGDFYLLDVNSVYPFVMSIHDYPTKLVSVYSRVSLTELSYILKHYLVIADVTLNTPENSFPKRSKTGLLFPLGTFRTVLPTAEFELAAARGYIQKIHSMAVYQHAPLFNSYVQALYTMRRSYQEAGNMTYEYLCKLMLNSLYGKFGQRGRVYKDSGPAEDNTARSWEEWDVDTKTFVKYRQFGGMVQTWYDEGESFNSHPAIAAHVTSYARIYLDKLMHDAGRENVYYVDTDSLVVNKKGFESLSAFYLGTALGELKLEKQFNHLVIHGAKDYVFGDKAKIKGVRAKAQQIGDNEFTQEKFSKFKGMVRAGSLDSMIVTPETKHLTRDYKKGSVTNSGRVEPFHTEDGEIDPDMEVYKRKAAAELYSKILLIGEGSKLKEWLNDELKAMESDLSRRNIPYGGDLGAFKGQNMGYFQGIPTKCLDTRWQVFTDYLTTQS